MIEFNAELALHLWQVAAREEFGVVINVNPDDVQKIQNTMYAVRRESGEPELERLVMHVNETGTVITIKPRLHNALP